MNTKTTKIILLAFGVAALSSCSTAYRMGQTPDDVYFSPARPQTERQQDEYVTAPNSSQRYSGSDRYDNYDDYENYRNDRFLRMSMGSRMRLSAFDNYYWNDGYSSWKYNNYGHNFNSPWNSYYYWNNYYNPYSSYSLYSPFYGGMGGGLYGGGGIIINNSPKVPVNTVSRPGAFGRGSYMNNSFSNTNMYLDRNATTTRPTSNTVRSRYNNNNSYYDNNNSGNSNKRQSTSENSFFNNNNTRSNSTNNTYSQPSRTYEAPSRSYSPSSSGSSSGGGGGGGGVSRPTRGGN